VASVIESANGTLTLFFEPTPEQRELYAERIRVLASTSKA